MSDRRRNFFILLLVAGLLAGSALAIATKKTRLGLDLRGGVQLIYQGKPTPQQPKVDAQAIDRALDIMRERVDKLGVSEPEIQRSGPDQIQVGLPDVDNPERAIQQVGTTAQLYFYDWEPNVLGEDGKPAPDDPTVTETPSPLYDAVRRAAKRPKVADGDNTVGDRYYVVDDNRKTARGPEETEQDLFEDVPKQKGERVLKVNEGTVIVRQETDDDAEENFDVVLTRTGSRSEEVVKAIRAVTAVGLDLAQDIASDGGPIKRGVTEDEANDIKDRFEKAGATVDVRNAEIDQWFVLDDDPELSGTDIKNPEQNFDQGPGGNGQPIVTMEFTSKGRKKFHEVTRRIAQRGVESQVPGEPAESALQHFAIALDNELVSRPTIDFNELPDGIDGRTGAQISGGFTIQTAQDLANFLKIGALPIDLELISQSQVSATLGRQALNQGLLAGAVGLGIVALFLLLFYRVLGLIAVAALAVYALYFFAIIKLIPITLTLPGIAGLILTIGVAADANIVIFERVKEEIRAGRSIPAGIAAGYKKGFTAILDANVVTILVAFILFILATAGVKGFAFMLGLGVIVSLFTAVLATQAILGTLGRSRLMSSPSALGAGEQRVRFRFDFMGASKWFFSMSGIILLVGALAIGGKGLNLGIDFESGTRITTAVQRPADEDAIRSVMAAQGFESAEIQRVEDPELGKNVFQISTSELQPPDVQRVKRALAQRFGEENFSNTSIGPTFGQTVANSALIAIVASLLIISAYIALRFEWKYAVPVLIALMHDILITSGVYALTDREVTTSTVAALLTVLGFSLYDTIIVFDRIRENVPRMPRASFSQIVNRSMSEVLARSLATSFCAALPVMALLFFGGETLRDFAFALFIGTLSGTYSSVFIAGPVLTHWKEREKVYRQRTARIQQEFGGLVPAYAVATHGGVPTEPVVARAVAPAGSRRLTTPDEPAEVSPEEFEEMVRDLHEDGADGADGAATPARAPIGTPAARAGSGAGASRPPGPPKAKRAKTKKPRNKRHGRKR